MPHLTTRVDALILALILSVAQTGLSAVGGARRSAMLAGAGRGAHCGAGARELTSIVQHPA